MLRTRALLILIVFLFDSRLSAQLTASQAEWANGPVRWLMTENERRAWSAASNDEAAANEFIDLFWARRDPTPGTATNEYKDEFERRVSEADKLFSNGGRRGSLTDPGRVYVVLGPPDRTFLPSPQPATGARGTKLRYIRFTYADPAALRLTGPITFVENRKTQAFHIDPQNGNAFGALDRAARRAIVSAEMKSVPAWAQRFELQWNDTAANTQNFLITLVRGSVRPSDNSTAALPPGVPEAIADLRTLLPYKSYELIDSTRMTSRGGGTVSGRLRGSGNTRYEVFVEFAVSAKKVNVSKFQVLQEGEPGAAAVPRELMNLSFSMGRGETTSVGASNRQGGDALLFFVTALSP